ncbi:unnamed protein product [Sphenostylis stenocarpa]|uniref:Uncharacterized protein n=1 Tax=Sphenostylis stenocarpa TaxID=92480 RepID=A0AA86SPH0_9FABA|nr:unnamed protein product [Sphenostylis stenocarpa]
MSKNSKESFPGSQNTKTGQNKSRPPSQSWDGRPNYPRTSETRVPHVGRPSHFPRARLRVKNSSGTAVPPRTVVPARTARPGCAE